MSKVFSSAFLPFLHRNEPMQEHVSLGCMALIGRNAHIASTSKRNFHAFYFYFFRNVHNYTAGNMTQANLTCVQLVSKFYVDVSHQMYPGFCRNISTIFLFPHLAVSHVVWRDFTPADRGRPDHVVSSPQSGLSQTQRRESQ